jgi:2-amino-4-hydroxy-6-hydroxymethyldihydropteridine diphosphokinase
MNNVFLLLGSNLGDREQSLHQAIHLISVEIGTIAKLSAVYETQSWGKTDQPDYLNQVMLLQTTLSAKAVLEKILNIELRMGRVRDEKWGARIIDIDILFYNSDIIDEPGLHIPHPELHNRRFTLVPLAEIAPFFIHPVLSKEIRQIKNEIKDTLIVKKLYF